MYGSLVNHVQDQGRRGQPEPEVGMGCTFLYWSDREPGTIIEVGASGKSIRVRPDDFKLVGGSTASEQQEYEFLPNPHATSVVFTLRKNGRWVRQGESMREGQSVALGYRDRYVDPSF